MDSWVRRLLPLFEVGAGAIIVVVAMIVQPPSDTWLYLGFATLALVPLVHVVLTNMHAETLMRELARVQARDLDEMDKRIEKLGDIVKQMKKVEDPSSPLATRPSTLEEVTSKLEELVGRLASVTPLPGTTKAPPVQPPHGGDGQRG